MKRCREERRPTRRLILAATAIAAAMSGRSICADDGMKYPLTRRVDQVDVYQGDRVADPYRWLENLDSPETRAWVDAQNALTRSQIESLPARRYFAERLRALITYERYGVPQHRAGRYAYEYNNGSQEQNGLWVTEAPAERGTVAVDPNALRPDGTLSLGEYELSPDGKKLAYALSDGGSDWTTWQVRDLEGSRVLPEVLRGTKFTNISWSRDNRGFYYSRYPEAPGGGYDDARQVSVWYHRLGEEQPADAAIYAITDHPTRNPYPIVTEDGAYLVIRVEEGYQTNGVYYQQLGKQLGKQPGKAAARVVRLLDRWDALYQFLGNQGPVFFFQTTQRAPAGRVIAVDTRHPEPEHWREVVQEAGDAITAASLVGGRLIVQYVANVKASVKVFDLDGHFIRDVSLPGAGSVEGFEGPSLKTETFFSYTDFMTPSAVYRYDVSTGRSAALRAPPVGIQPDQYVTRQVQYTSRDGTRIPMYIVHRRNLAPDGRRPTVLYGYGGFDISLLPAYSVSRAAWLEAGGVYAVANLRGGGEFGEQWHESGTRLKKQNVFDDFIAAAERLIREGYTDREHLAIWGGSNGGLLVGAVLNQRPDLFAAAVPAVGVMDMLRYQLGSANARQWSSDYGLSEVPEEFRALYAYSPYHNVRPHQCYPPTLVLADANDDRVSPWHSYKYAAALQNAQGCDHPVLIRIETRSGHGAGASTSKIVEEYADQWAFVSSALGFRVPTP